jgi:hypothetical protein
MSGGLRSGYASARAVRGLWIKWPLVAAAVAVVAALPSTRAAGPSHEATTSAAARQEARAAIPLSKVDPAYRRKVGEVLADPSIFRRMPTNVVDCNPEMFTFLAQNPEVLTEIWRHLDVSKVEVIRTSASTFDLRDNAGTTGALAVVEQTCERGAQNRIVMYAEGSYEGKPFHGPVSARCVLLLRSGSVRETNGRDYVAARLDSFVKIDRATVEIMAQVAHPFVGRTADRNFADTLAFISNLSYTAEQQPETIVELAGQLKTVDTDRRAHLGELARECAEAATALKVSRAVQAAGNTTAR